MRTTKTYNIWTKEEEEKLKKLVSITSFEKMVKYFPNRTATSLFKKASKLGYFSAYKNFKYTVNEDYWKDLDLVKCYYAGFIAADGNLSKKNYQLQINISSKDVDILERFKKEVNFTGKVLVYARKKYKSDELMEVCYLCINRVKKWYPDLKEKFNITPQKTFTLQPPNLNNKYLELAYLIGLIDGDGLVCFLPSRNNESRIGFVNASDSMVKWVCEMFSSIFKNNYSMQRNSKNGVLEKCSSISISGLPSAIIIDYLRQFPVPKLARKWENPEILKYIEVQKQKHPNLFLKLDLLEISNLLPNNSSQSSSLV